MVQERKYIKKKNTRGENDPKNASLSTLIPLSPSRLHENLGENFGHALKMQFCVTYILSG